MNIQSINEIIEEFEEEYGYLFDLDKTRTIHSTPALNQGTKNVVKEYFKQNLEEVVDGIPKDLEECCCQYRCSCYEEVIQDYKTKLKG